ncbi:hypothetical protein FRAHR75_1600006 [Frankia sp. Hr75.2]|nr:hypothetical protein FRAHR75_1600006 [Frankia sp. Hr75.2]
MPWRPVPGSVDPGAEDPSAPSSDRLSQRHPAPRVAPPHAPNRKASPHTIAVTLIAPYETWPTFRQCLDLHRSALRHQARHTRPHRPLW